MTKRPTSFDELPLLLRVEELMPILGIGLSSAYELVNSGQIKSIKLGRTRQTRILKQDVEAVLERGCTSYDDDLSK